MQALLIPAMGIAIMTERGALWRRGGWHTKGDTRAATQCQKSQSKRSVVSPIVMNIGAAVVDQWDNIHVGTSLSRRLEQVYACFYTPH